MTSANITYYTVTDSDGKIVLQCEQHHFCQSTARAKLEALPNPEKLTIVANWPDEEERDNESSPLNLAAYLAGEAMEFPSLMDSSQLHEDNKKLQARIDELEKDSAALKRITKAMADGWDFDSLTSSEYVPFNPADQFNKTLYSVWIRDKANTIAYHYAIVDPTTPVHQALLSMMDKADIPKYEEDASKDTKDTEDLKGSTYEE